MTYSICIPTVSRPYRGHVFTRLLETRTLEHPLISGFHIAYNRLPNENALYAMRLAIADRADWIIFMEDDIEIIDDFLGSTDRWLRDFADARTHFYPLGCGVRRAFLRAQQAGAHKWDWPIRHFYGATAVAFRREDAERFCDVAETCPAWMVDVTGLDENMKRWHQRAYPDVQTVPTPIPCFVNHLGQQTSQTMAPEHWTGDYVGFIGTQTTY